MDDIYCGCGIRLRQWFNDVFSCPRCQTIIVKKDHVTLTWSGARALVLLDEFEKYITRVLLGCREEAAASMAAEARPTVVIPEKDLKDLRPCDNCGTHMKIGCSEKCSNCGWISPCSIE